MRRIGCSRGIRPFWGLRSALLAACSLCWLSVPAAGWALDTGDGAGVTAFSQALHLNESLSATASGSGSTDRLVQDAPILGALQLSLGRLHQGQLTAFSYAGKASPQALGLTAARGLAAGLPQGPAGRSSGLAPGLQALDDRATSLKAEYGQGAAKLSVDFSDVGARFPEAAAALQSADQATVEALKVQAGLRSLNLSAALQLAPGASLTSTGASLRNDKPGDEKRGLTTTDWSNTLALSLGPRSTIKLGLTDHGEAWDPSAGKTDLNRRTSQFSWDTAFGAGGANTIRLGLTDVRTKQAGQEQSERTQELHLALAPLARLKLTADQVAKEDAQGATQTTNVVGAVMQLAAGSQLTTSLKTTAPEGSAETRERYLKLAGALGAGATTAQLVAEQKVTQTAGAGALEESKYEVTGGLGTGPGQVHVHGLYQQKRADGADGAVEGSSLLHVDRALGPRVKLSADQEQVLSGTNGQPQATAKATTAVAADLDARTKLTAGVSSQRCAAGVPQSTRDLLLERRVAEMVVRTEDHQRSDTTQTSTRTYGADLPMGKLPAWAADGSRRHEFDEIYDFLVAREAAWLNLPFSGLRYARTQRRAGPDDGANTTIVSYRAMLAQRYQLQFTYHDRPEYEEGDQKGRPMDLSRRHLALGAPVAGSLIARGWLTLEAKTADPLSGRSSRGFGVSGKVRGDARLEVSYAQDRGQWEGQAVARDSLAVLYAHRVSDENQIALKVGYAWGQSSASGRDADCRLSVQYNKPV